MPNTIALPALDPADGPSITWACYAWNQVRIDFEGRRCRYFILEHTPDGPFARAYWSLPEALKPWHLPDDWLANLVERWGVPHEPAELRRYVAQRLRGIKLSPGRPPERRHASAHHLYLDAGASWDGKLPRYWDELRAFYESEKQRFREEGCLGAVWRAALDSAAERFGIGAESLRKVLHSKG